MSKGKARCRAMRHNLMRTMTANYRKKQQAYIKTEYDKPQQAVSGES